MQRPPGILGRGEFSQLAVAFVKERSLQKDNSFSCDIKGGGGG